MTAPTTARLLTRAATIIHAQGWTRDDWYETAYDQAGNPLDPAASPVCAMAAINVAAGTQPTDPIGGDRIDAAEALAAHLGLALDAEIDGPEALEEAIGRWNDAPGRTADEVAAAFLACAHEQETGR